MFFSALDNSLRFLIILPSSSQKVSSGFMSATFLYATSLSFSSLVFCSLGIPGFLVSLFSVCFVGVVFVCALFSVFLSALLVLFLFVRCFLFLSALLALFFCFLFLGTRFLSDFPLSSDFLAGAVIFTPGFSGIALAETVIFRGLGSSVPLGVLSLSLRFLPELAALLIFIFSPFTSSAGITNI